MKAIMLLLVAILLMPVAARTQANPSTNFYSAIRKYDAAKLWRGDSIRADDGQWDGFPEPLGYIGEHYQRFYIHYLSVTKSTTDSYLYIVRGKTRVKENICDFTGTIRIVKAVLYKGSEDPHYKEGTVTCKVSFYEDSTQHSTGFINGELTTDFCIDAKGRISYDALTSFADSYSNNQCQARWTSYLNKKSRKCNWGDYRIPDSKNLDYGAGAFTLNEKYIRYGWESYEKAYSLDEKEAKKARAIEDREWWK